ncbi:MAG: META domain-containing protein [Prevotellaceae bacterium]|jgi:heat shock protein HslJ|nr:META domain-containing protein [Prevotellaceae bacterium]
MKLKLIAIVVLCSVTLLNSACSVSKKVTTAKGIPTDGQGNITALEWGLISVRSKDGKKTLPAPKEQLPTLRITTEGRAAGYAGCNNFFGPVTIDGYSLKFGNMASTMKMCVSVMDVENAIMAIFEEVDNYTVANGNLLLRKGKEVLATYSSFR